MNRNSALITGATSGFGKATACLLAQNKYNLFITGRRHERLEDLSKDLSEKYDIECIPLCFDVSSRKQSECIVENYKDKLNGLNVLVNNAGLARGVERVDDAHLDDWEIMVNTNILGLMYMTRLLLPFLKKSNCWGHIVNVGSVAGRWSYPGGSVYCATKFAVRGFSECMRWDLDGSNIRVTNIEPGRAETEFSLTRYKGDVEKARSIYKDNHPLTSEDIAETILWCLDRPQHVNIQEVVIVPTDQPGVPAFPKVK